MKFYLVEITTYVDGSPEAKAVYEYDNLDSATAAFHQKMAGAMNNENYASEYCCIIEKSTNQLKRYEYYVRPSATPDDQGQKVEETKKSTRKAVK